jgi:hypothetical protein
MVQRHNQTPAEKLAQPRNFVLLHVVMSFPVDSAALQAAFSAAAPMLFPNLFSEGPLDAGCVIGCNACFALSADVSSHVAHVIRNHVTAYGGGVHFAGLPAAKSVDFATVGTSFKIHCSGCTARDLSMAEFAEHLSGGCRFDFAREVATVLRASQLGCTANTCATEPKDAAAASKPKKTVNDLSDEQFDAKLKEKMATLKASEDRKIAAYKVPQGNLKRSVRDCKASIRKLNERLTEIQRCETKTREMQIEEATTLSNLNIKQSALKKLEDAIEAGKPTDDHHTSDESEPAPPKRQKADDSDSDISD